MSSKRYVGWLAVWLLLFGLVLLPGLIVLLYEYGHALSLVRISILLMTVWNVWDFRNNISKGKNDPEYVRKKRGLGKMINKKYTIGTRNPLSSAHTIQNSPRIKKRLDSFNPTDTKRVPGWIYSI